MFLQAPYVLLLNTEEQAKFKKIVDTYASLIFVTKATILMIIFANSSEVSFS